jgi:hypothetical protein
MTRKFSSTSVATTLNAGINSSATSIVVATGTGAALMGGVTLTAGNVDSFGLALDVDTQNEEVVWVTGVSGDTLTVVRAKAGTSAIAHTAGATVKHVFTGDDATFFTTGTTTADNAIPESVVTAKGDLLVATGSGVVARQAIGTNGYVLTADSTLTNGIKWSAAAAGDVTLTGTQTLTNKTLSSAVLTGTLTAGGGVGTNGQVLASTGTGVQWSAVSAGYSAPTLGSTLIPSATTVTTIAGLTLTSPVLNDPKLNLSINANTATTYTFVLTDNGKLVTSNNASAQTLSIPTNASVAFPIGTQINVAWITGAGQPTINAVTSGTTTVLSTAAISTAPKLRVANSVVTCIKIATDTWLVTGDIA